MCIYSNEVSLLCFRWRYFLRTKRYQRDLKSFMQSVEIFNRNIYGCIVEAKSGVGVQRSHRECAHAPHMLPPTADEARAFGLSPQSPAALLKKELIEQRPSTTRSTAATAITPTTVPLVRSEDRKQQQALVNHLAKRLSLTSPVVQQSSKQPKLFVIEPSQSNVASATVNSRDNFASPSPRSPQLQAGRESGDGCRTRSASSSKLRPSFAFEDESGASSPTLVVDEVEDELIRPSSSAAAESFDQQPRVIICRQQPYNPNQLQNKVKNRIPISKFVAN